MKLFNRTVATLAAVLIALAAVLFGSSATAGAATASGIYNPCPPANQGFHLTTCVKEPKVKVEVCECVGDQGRKVVIEITNQNLAGASIAYKVKLIKGTNQLVYEGTTSVPAGATRKVSDLPTAVSPGEYYVKVIDDKWHIKVKKDLKVKRCTPPSTTSTPPTSTTTTTTEPPATTTTTESPATTTTEPVTTTTESTTTPTLVEAGNPQPPQSGGQLAETGVSSKTGWVLGIGGLLIAAGIGAVFFTRRRGARSS